MRMSLGLSLNRRRANTGTGFDLTLTVDAEIEIDGATGEVTVTVTSPAVYANYNAGNGAGIFIFNGDDLATGPVNLVPPQIIDDGSPASGETLTLTPGLWVYRPGNGGLGSPTYQWQADAAGNAVFANIGGATSNSYTLTAGESGDDVRVQESLADNGGSRTATSAAVSVASGVVTFTRVASGTNAAQVNNGNQLAAWTGIDLSSIPVGNEVMAAVAWSDFSSAGSGSTVGAPTLGGVLMTRIPGNVSNNAGTLNNVPRVDLYRLAMPDAGSIPDRSNVSLRMGVVTGASAVGWHYYIYHVQNRTADVDADFDETIAGETVVNTVAGGSVFTLAITKDADNNSDSFVFTNVTQDGAEQRIVNNNLSAVAKAENVAGGSRTVTAPRPINGAQTAVVTLSVS